jgi:ERCC4-type nuclease
MDHGNQNMKTEIFLIYLVFRKIFNIRRSWNLLLAILVSYCFEFISKQNPEPTAKILFEIKMTDSQKNT